MNPDSATGRQLDAMLARHLFNLEVEERENVRTRETDIVCREPGKPWAQCAYFAEGMGGSLNVQYELSRRGWSWRPDRGTGSKWSQPGIGRVVLEHSSGRVVEAEGATVNEALARAAVKAVIPLSSP
jgi:hypothetical protein